MPDLFRLTLLTHVAATWFMVGLIWFVQIVHYPLMQHVGRAEFVAYEQLHSRWTTSVVGPAMLLEVATLIGLLNMRSANMPPATLWASAALLAIIWISTQFVQVPCHDALCRSWDAVIHRRLVATNWIRTIAWTIRGVLVVRWIWILLAAKT